MRHFSVMCYYIALRLDNFKFFKKTQSEKHAIELLLTPLFIKVQISPDQPKEGYFYVHIHFWELYRAFNGISHYKLFIIVLIQREIISM